MADRRWETWTQATLSEGDRLIDALHSYYAERGHYPDELLRLVPDYINRIPELQFKYRILGFDYSGGRDTFILSFSVGNAVNCSYRQTTGDDVWECTPVCRVRKENCRFH
ncbi:hypothetical protein JXA80_12820 [bacterium]|nr:hypothetical protein [candidate division CSSED10-310 bacterium]